MQLKLYLKPQNIAT